jgi:alkanesulfonate monooxygenase SsuD/methylene tetrahydromethanopterin reductase-like flavin-dependent oxidoreductase (luciferase family)
MRFAVFSHIAQKESVSIHQRLREFADEARLADELGFDYFFTTEHHFSGRFSLSPSQPVSLAVLAQVTERIRFGPMIIILPIVQPLRVIEELLILDHMSNGRLDIGVGRGITPHEHITYGIDTRTDRERFTEGLEILLKSFATEGHFSWLGKHFQYFDVQLPWTSLQKPHPPIWVPTNSADSAYEYGKRGFKTGGFGVLGMDMYEPVFNEYRRGWDDGGHAVEDRRVAFLASIVVADTDEEARDLGYEHFARQMRLFEYERERTHAVVDSELQALAERSLHRLRQIRNDPERAEAEIRFITGTPDTVIERIEEVRQRLGVDTFIGEFSFGELPYEVVEHSYDLFAKGVMPAFAGVG